MCCRCGIVGHGGNYYSKAEDQGNPQTEFPFGPWLRSQQGGRCVLIQTAPGTNDEDKAPNNKRKGVSKEVLAKFANMTMKDRLET